MAVGNRAHWAGRVYFLLEWTQYKHNGQNMFLIIQLMVSAMAIDYLNISNASAPLLV